MHNAITTVQHMDDKGLTPIAPTLVNLMVKLLHTIPTRIKNYMLESLRVIGHIKAEMKTNISETCPISIIVVGVRTDCTLFCQLHAYWHTR